MIPWIVMAVIAVPLVVVAFVAARRRTREAEGLDAEDPETTREIEREFAAAERYEEKWREEQRHSRPD